MKQFFLLVYFSLFSTLLFSQSTEESEVNFSYKSGVYKEKIQLIISSKDSSKLFYSLDGDYPKTEYEAPLSISKNTTIRVKKENSLKGYTRNYIFLNRKLTLPIVCITLKPEDLFDNASGIYVKGNNAADKPPYRGANYHKNWEKSCYVEFIDTNNKVGFNQKVGLKIFGQFSSMLPQKSFSIHARKKYGKKRIKYPIFPDLPFKKYKSFVLRNSGSDNNNSHIRDVMMTSLVKNLNLDVQAYRPCIVYLNGKYWGIYHLREKINEHYIKQHYKVNKDSIAIMKHKSDVQYYGRLNYLKLIKFIEKTDFSIKDNLRILENKIDIDNYLDYNIAQVYFNNIDAGGNIRYWRHRKKGSKWRWILFDTDFGFGLSNSRRAKENSLKDFTTKSKENWPHPAWSTLLIRKLLQNDSIKNIYIRKFTHYLNTTFEPKNVEYHILSISNQIKEEIPFHFKRWKKKSEYWSKNIDKLIQYSDKKSSYMFLHLAQKFNLDTTHKLTITNPKNGFIEFDSYPVNSEQEGTYFSNKSYTIKATPKFGYYFSNWSGVSESTDSIISFLITTDTFIHANFIRKPISKLFKKIRFNEISHKDSLYSDYIELHNTSSSEIDISGWVLRNKKTYYTIKPNSIISPQAYFVLYRDSSKLKFEIENGQGGLFKIKRKMVLELFTKEEKLVDTLPLSKYLFRKRTTIEYVNSVIKTGWVSSKSPSVNSENKEEIKNRKTNRIILISFISLISLILFTAIIFYFVNRKTKRPRSSTE